MTKVIILNAPANSGKDFVALELIQHFGYNHLEFKAPMYQIAQAITGLSKKAFFDIYNDRDKKEVEQPEFLGFSPRGLMIHISEKFIKPTFGKEFFGNCLANKIVMNDVNIVTDSGFPEELKPVIDEVGAENVYVIRFNRNGSEFESDDSRDYLTPPQFTVGNRPKFAPFYNNDSSIEDFVCHILTSIGEYS